MSWQIELDWLPTVVANTTRPRAEQATKEGGELATHMKRSLAQRARWMLAEHLKETTHVRG